MKIFISGKITGLNYYYAFQKFKAAEKRLTQLGYEVKNPMRLCKPHWSWYAAWQSACGASSVARKSTSSTTTPTPAAPA